MPLYEYRCVRKGHVFERVLPVAEYRTPQSCTCGSIAEKVILHAPKVFSDYEGYESPASGNWIQGRRARTEDLARTGCRPYEDGEREMAERHQKQADKELDSAVDEAVERTVAEL